MGREVRSSSLDGTAFSSDFAVATCYPLNGSKLIYEFVYLFGRPIRIGMSIAEDDDGNGI